MSERSRPPHHRRIRGSGPALLLAALVVLATGVLFAGRSFAYFSVTGPSMEPTFQDGDLVVVKRAEGLRRGDLVFFHAPPAWHLHPRKGSDVLVKRIVARPGDHLKVEGGSFRVNGREVARLSPTAPCPRGPHLYERRLTGDEVLVMGDNASRSYDSRAAFCQEGADQMYASASEVVASGSLLFTL